MTCKPGCCFILPAIVWMIAMPAKGQDPHTIGIESMKTWYNPSLKTDKIPLASFNYRHVNYPGILGYDSKSATLELAFLPANVTDDDNVHYVSLSAGMNVDNASNGFMSASTALLGVSYAMPLNYDNTYMAIGLQANYSFNKIGNDRTISFPEKFDRGGALN